METTEEEGIKKMREVVMTTFKVSEEEAGVIITADLKTTSDCIRDIMLLAKAIVSTKTQNLEEKRKLLIYHTVFSSVAFNFITVCSTVSTEEALRSMFEKTLSKSTLEEIKNGKRVFFF